LGDLPIFFQEICISLAEIHKSLGEIGISPSEIDRFLVPSTSGGEEIYPVSPRLGMVLG